MGLFEKIFGKSENSNRADIELRFERIRSAVSGTMSNFFVAKDRFNNNEIVGVKLCDIEKVDFFENRFKGLNKPSEGQIALGMVHPNIAKTIEFGLSTKANPI